VEGVLVLQLSVLWDLLHDLRHFLEANIPILILLHLCTHVVLAECLEIG
jgi:hypothetical protein